MKKLSSFLTKIVLLSFFLAAFSPIFAVSDAFATPAPAPAPAAAAANVDASDENDNVLVRTMCNALQIVTGNAGKAFAAFAIISIGIGFFTGKVSWGLMIGVAAGIAAMFGAPSIVAAITGEGTFNCNGF